MVTRGQADQFCIYRQDGNQDIPVLAIDCSPTWLPGESGMAMHALEKPLFFYAFLTIHHPSCVPSVLPA
ncbi:predicted protein [Histoplasma mississippiense (nom. inval.)]|uniref:predicted protein n=1 Tax=Ajellomyces capsulatus (strain NAm1 / WU24) TaxID=2059318 RepID=UPI000157CE1E|nr:predicted protein [Histoplasma mississippiense (nom. inval.)]EDN10190.1 predicted protein [Histoplasma mississippiense (nom. inval.)]